MSAGRKMFGEVAFERGYVSSEQLYEALAIQARDEARGRPYRFLGEILIDLGFITEKQVLDVLNDLHAVENVEEEVH